MPAWVIPALKAVLPHVITIISATAPVFTKNHREAGADHSPLLRQQITELQTAASQNASHIRELAAQLQNTVGTLERAALIAEAKLRRALYFCTAATILSVTALGVALWAILAG